MSRIFLLLFAFSALPAQAQFRSPAQEKLTINIGLAQNDAILAYQYQTSNGIDARPPVKPLRIGAQMLGGWVGGAVGVSIPFTIGLFGLASGASLSSVDFNFSLLMIGLFYTAGNAAGVYGIGSIGDQTGSFWWTAVGSAVGVAAAILVANGLDVDENQEAFGFLPPGLAILAFTLTRRYDYDAQPVSAAALIMVDKAGARVGIPNFSPTLYSNVNKLQIGWHCNLLSVNL